MNVDVGPVEAFWLTVTVAAFIFTVGALVDALEDRRAVMALNGHAREVAADGIVVQERLATLTQVVLIAIIVPQLFSDREITLTPGVIGIMIVPVLLLIMSAARARTRRQLVGLIATDLADAHKVAFARLDEAVAEVRDITQGAREEAHVAASAAKNVDQKIADAQVSLLIQGEAQAATAETAARVEETTADTRERVIDLQERGT